MTNQNAFLPSNYVTFVLKNNSSIGRTIKVFNTKIGPGNSLDLMKLPGITEEDIRSEIQKSYLRNLLVGGSLQVTACSVDFTTPDTTYGAFLASLGISSSNVSSSALTQTSWYVDPVNGNNTNDGLTSGTAIKTVAELSRRWGKGNLLSPPGANGASSVAITVNILNNVPSTDPLNLDVVLDGNVRLIFLGGVATSTPLTVTSVTARNRATNTPWQFTATGGVTVANRIYDSTVNAYFWTVKDQGANSWRISEPCTKPNVGSLLSSGNQVAIADTDTFALQTLYTLKLGDIKVSQIRNTSAGSPFGTSLIFRDLDLTGDYAPELSSNTSAYVYECKFSRSIMPATGSFNNLQNCCQPVGFVIRPIGSLIRFYAGAYIGNATSFAPTTTVSQFNTDIIFQGNSLSFVGSNVLAILGGCGIFDSVPGGNGNTNAAGNGLMVAGGQVAIRGTTAYLWGSGQTGAGIGVETGSSLIYSDNVPTITGSTPGTNDFVLGGATSTYGVAADGYLVGPTTNSWANFANTLGAGTGHGTHATNPQKQASLLKV